MDHEISQFVVHGSVSIQNQCTPIFGNIKPRCCLFFAGNESAAGHMLPEQICFIEVKCLFWCVISFHSLQ